MTSVNIGNSVTTIENYTFEYCTALTNLTIGSSVTSIGISAFNGCSSLTSVSTPKSVTTIDDNAFANCSSLTNVSLPNSVTFIGYNAFKGCISLTSVNIPDSVIYIGDGAFWGCNLTGSLTIPNTVITIGDNAFRSCSNLTGIRVQSGNAVYDSRNNCNAIIETESNTLLYGCKKTIIPNTVTNIKDYAFQGCSGLTNITIPNSVTSIGVYAFYGCDLNKVTCISNTPPAAESDSFDYNSYNTATLYVPATSLNSYKYKIPWKNFKKIEAMPEYVTGDVDGDGHININDVTGLINILLSGETPSAGADVDGDGRINIDDVTALINNLLNGNK